MKRILFYSVIAFALGIGVNVVAQNGLIQLGDGTIGIKTVPFDTTGSVVDPLDASDLSQDATHDAAATTTGPQNMCYASDAQPTAISADADAARIWCDQNGRVITSPYSSNANWVKGVANVTDATMQQSVVAAQGAGISFCATTIVVSNSSATAVTVAMTDGSGGSTIMTIPASANMGGAVIPLPVPMCTSANTALFADISTNASTIAVTAVGFKSAL